MCGYERFIFVKNRYGNFIVDVQEDNWHLFESISIRDLSNIVKLLNGVVNNE